MIYLYGTKPGVDRRLVATFDSEEQLQVYTRWATLSGQKGAYRFEQGSALVGYQDWSYTPQPQTDDDPTTVVHNPSPSML